MVAWGLVGLCAAPACSGEDFTSNGSVPWTSRTLDTLSMAEREQLCRELHAEVDGTADSTRYRSWSCTSEGWTATEDAPDSVRATQCQSVYEQCLATSNLTLSSSLNCLEVVPSLNLACTTVGDLRSCYRAWGPPIEQAYALVLQDLPNNCVEAVQAGGAITTAGSVVIDMPNECLDVRRGCGL
jgi:hypothetical protein